MNLWRGFKQKRVFAKELLGRKYRALLRLYLNLWRGTSPDFVSKPIALAVPVHTLSGLLRVSRATGCSRRFCNKGTFFANVALKSGGALLAANVTTRGSGQVRSGYYSAEVEDHEGQAKENVES
jgi:predicted outer membrane repeat protein